MKLVFNRSLENKCFFFARMPVIWRRYARAEVDPDLDDLLPRYTQVAFDDVKADHPVLLRFDTMEGDAQKGGAKRKNT